MFKINEVGLVLIFSYIANYYYYTSHNVWCILFILKYMIISGVILGVIYFLKINKK
jgi:hypothetical protein